jgi:UDPglucose 6-dehydrogenase
LGTLAGKRLGVLGLSFKPGTDDVRESPAVAIARALAREGAEVCAHDPVAMDKARGVLGDRQITYAHDSYDAAHGSDALLILTEWQQFADLDLHRLRSVMKTQLIFDGRNMYSPREMAAAGFAYHSVGRAPIEVKPKMTTLDALAMSPFDVSLGDEPSRAIALA